MNEKKRVAMYVRVSTNEQRTDLQENELKEYAERRGWTVYRVYKDHGESGAKRSRPALDEMLADCRRRRFEVIAIWKLDRLARSLAQLIYIVELCKTVGVQFLSLTDSVDTTSPAGMLVFHVFGAIAQFERELIRERTMAGVREARRKGKRIGRPAVAVTQEQVESIRKERTEKKLSIRKLARKFGLSASRVHLLCRKACGSV